MRLLTGADQAVSAWVAARIPQCGEGWSWGPHSAFGILDSAGRPVAGVVFHGYMPRFGCIEISFAADRADWLTRRLASAIMHYPFAQLGVQRLSTSTPKRNRRAREFVERFGFKREGLIRKGFGTDDAVLSGMLASEWATSRFNTRSLARNAASPAPILRA